MLNMLGESDSILKKHLDAPAKKNAHYLSPRSQNEMITVIGIHMIQDAILKEIREAKFFAVLADEVGVHNKELLKIGRC